jgi:hypothetical protein
MTVEKPARPEKLNLYQQGFDFVEFRDLPVPYQMAMAWYMAVDGEAWDDIIDYDAVEIPDDAQQGDHSHDAAYKATLRKLLPEFVAQYGDVEFGVATWSTEDLIASIAGDDGFREEEPDIEGTRSNFAEPIKGYFTTRYPETDRWPVIMSNEDDETLQDGWHRFHIYVSNGHKDIPVIFYPEEWHREFKASMEAARPAI